MRPDHPDFAAISAAVDAVVAKAEGWAGVVITSAGQAAELEALRRELSAIKQRATDARNAEHLPLVEAAQAVLARYNPKLEKVKRTDDPLRHQLAAWRKRQREMTHHV